MRERQDLPWISVRNAVNHSYRGQREDREVEKATAKRPRNIISTGNSRELKRYVGTRKCNIQGKGESGENLPAGRQEGRNTKRSICFSLFPFFHFSFVTQCRMPEIMNMFVKKRVNPSSVVLAVLFLSTVIGAQQYPKPRGWVNDFAQVVSPEYESKLTSLITEVKTKTGAEIAIVTIPTTKPESIEGYAVELFERWGVGKKGEDNGVLVVAAIEDRKLRIEVGYGLEGVLPDGLCGQIIRDVLTPNFRQGNFGKGLFIAGTVIASRIAKESNVQITGTESVPGIAQIQKRSPFRKLLRLIVFFLLFSMIFGGRFFLLPLLLLGGGRGYWGGGSFGGGGGFGGGFGGGMSGGGGASGGW
jgi:uncharacterized protein